MHVSLRLSVSPWCIQQRPPILSYLVRLHNTIAATSGLARIDKVNGEIITASGEGMGHGSARLPAEMKKDDEWANKADVESTESV